MYDCETYIRLPRPIGGGIRDAALSFISLSLLGIENSTEFEVSFYADDKTTRLNMGEIS